MNTGKLRLGMLSILMTVIVICMSVLSLLSYATSLADLRLARRYAETVRIRYELEEEGRALLKEGNTADIMETEIQKEGYALNIKADGDLSLWRIRRIWTEDDSIDELWNGD